ncbi:hypothetical protein A8B79_10360 [Balneola sp. EhC07]|nr:hypothetical protein A8B79_10360 [Balneola sp. EhC07]
MALYNKFVLNNSVTVITASENVFKACEYIDIPVLRHRLFKIRSFFTEIKAVKKEITTILNIVDNDELHFSHTQFAVFCFLLIHTMIKKGERPIFHDFEMVYNSFRKKIPNFREAKLIIQKLLLVVFYEKVPLELRKTTKKNVMISLNLNFIKENSLVIEYETNQYYEKTLELFGKLNIDYSPFNFLFVAQNIKIGSHNSKEYNKKVSEIYNLLEQYAFVVKMHPKLGNIGSLSNLETLPEFLPVEFFFNKVKHAVVSFSSASLVTASKMGGVSVISLNDLLPNNDDFTKQAKEKLISDSEGEIKFVKSIFELKNYLNEKLNA